MHHTAKRKMLKRVVEDEDGGECDDILCILAHLNSEIILAYNFILIKSVTIKVLIIDSNNRSFDSRRKLETLKCTLRS